MEAAVTASENAQNGGAPDLPARSDAMIGYGGVVWARSTAGNHEGGGCCSAVLAAEGIVVTWISCYDFVCGHCCAQ